MPKKKNAGKVFESNFQESCEALGLFNDRIKDPPYSSSTASKNKYDYYLYMKPHLFALELKSTKSKSVSFAENIIRPHQIKNLVEADKYDGVIAGFLFNFRTETNDTYFVHIKEFMRYKAVAELGSEHHDYVKLNRSSIPIDVCEQIGIKIHNYLKKTNFHYHVKDFVEVAINKYGE